MLWLWDSWNKQWHFLCTSGTTGAIYDNTNNHQKISLQFYSVDLKLEVCRQGVHRKGLRLGRSCSHFSLIVWLMIAKTVFYPFVCKFSELQKGSKAWGFPVFFWCVHNFTVLFLGVKFDYRFVCLLNSSFKISTFHTDKWGNFFWAGVVSLIRFLKVQILIFPLDRKPEVVSSVQEL